jgi:hypothetical protein
MRTRIHEARGCLRANRGTRNAYLDSRGNDWKCERGFRWRCRCVLEAMRSTSSGCCRSDRGFEPPDPDVPITGTCGGFETLLIDDGDDAALVADQFPAL